MRLSTQLASKRKLPRPPFALFRPTVWPSPRATAHLHTGRYLARRARIVYFGKLFLMNEPHGFKTLMHPGKVSRKQRQHDI